MCCGEKGGGRQNDGWNDAGLGSNQKSGKNRPKKKGGVGENDD